MEIFLERLNNLVWGVPALVLIIGVGIYLTIGTKAAQLRLLPKAIKRFFSNIRKGENASFQALCTALAATVGTGNIAGVAGAIALGGPGSIFWMWVCGILGMVTKFAEAALAVYFRDKDAQGNAVGGPMYMIRKGLRKRWHWLASVYCLFGVIAAFGMGNATQINAVTDGICSVTEAFGLGNNEWLKWIAGGGFAGLAAICLLGGAKRIGNISAMLVPVASVAYILLSLGALLVNFRQIPSALADIFQGAFQPAAVTGGAIGSAIISMRVGASRGVFTNEAGMGTAGIAHGSAESVKPVDQGMMGIMEVFLDTLVICTLTALVILTSGEPVSFGVDTGAVLTTKAFACTYGSGIHILIMLFLCCFSSATMLGWGLYALQCARYLFGDGSWKYFVILQFAASLVSLRLNTGLVWMLAETVNGMMAIPNLITVAILSPVLFRLLGKRKGAPRRSLKSTEG